MTLHQHHPLSDHADQPEESQAMTTAKRKTTNRLITAFIIDGKGRTLAAIVTSHPEVLRIMRNQWDEMRWQNQADLCHIREIDWTKR
jgi:hypothetical protein